MYLALDVLVTLYMLLFVGGTGHVKLLNEVVYVQSRTVISGVSFNKMSAIVQIQNL